MKIKKLLLVILGIGWLPFWFGKPPFHMAVLNAGIIQPATAVDGAFELEVIRLTNLERTNRGLPPLRRSDDLTIAARAHNQDMIDNDFFSHTGSDGSSPPVRACREGYQPYGWGDCYVGENIAAGYSTPASVVTGWMNSQGHKDNILNAKYREIGLGHSTGGSWGNYWTMALGAQPLVLPIFINDDDIETVSRNVTISLTHEDVSSWGSIGEITGVKISEDPTFTGESWQSWAAIKPFALSLGNGTKTVYVKFTDGVTETTSSDAIELNEAHPILAVMPLHVDIWAEAGGGIIVPSTILLSIANAGGGDLDWTALSDQPWLLPASDAGVAPDLISLSVDPNSTVLNSTGDKVANMTIFATDTNAANSPEIVTVTLFVVEDLYQNYLPLTVGAAP